RKLPEDDERDRLCFAIIAEKILVEGLRQNESAARDLGCVLGEIEGLGEVGVHAPELHVVEEGGPSGAEAIAAPQAHAQYSRVTLSVRDRDPAMKRAVRAAEGDEIGLDAVAQAIEITVLLNHGNLELDAKSLVVGFFPQPLQLASRQGMADQKHY